MTMRRDARSRDPTLGQAAITLTALAVLFAFSVFQPLMTDNLALGRTHASAWAMTLLSTPALYIFARTYGRAPLTNWWRLSWTAGLVMALVHLWFGLFEMHDGDPVSVFTRQGPLLSGTVFLLPVLWFWDVMNAWVRPDWREEDILSRRPAFWLAVVALFVSTVLFNNHAPSFTTGLILTSALLLAAFQRVDALASWREVFESPVPPVILGVGLVAAALMAPPIFSAGEMTPSEVAAAQAEWTVWPVLLLGGVAVTILIAKVPNAADWGWGGWWIAGAAAYLAHVYAGLGPVFGGSLAAMIAAQGWLVGGANLALAALWTASALAAWAGRRASPLHIGATALFVISTVLSTWERPGAVFWLGAALACLWLVAAEMRLLRR